ncbi:hypothetical protein DEJ17_06560 [Curtobacterium sp. MCSS17_011]|uniref:hypothetical protein n=1 Tax=Curtobacterium sp. MCSS17_011 TaxID=2175643 RepID=UPI000D882C23|nr:hypothetical protein [Curtobacterium sp. MCSS17_011]PYY60028.1 hypothetical protein DEJ17_06560 [Curtobacterium sp. MCSS17_011]
MTDPVDTDALRTPYDHFPDLRQAYSEGFERAYAEVERLRAESHAKDVVLLARDLKEQELRAVIENAPHGELCRWDRTDALAYRGQGANCTCWKAYAL